MVIGVRTVVTLEWGKIYIGVGWEETYWGDVFALHFDENNNDTLVKISQVIHFREE